MCIAIYHDAGCVLSQSDVDNSWRSNPDGGGFSYFDKDGALRIEKFMRKHEFEDAYDKATDMNPESPFAVHFRIATHGSVNLDNCHPHRVSDSMTLIHNGVIPVVINKKDVRSDTRIFCDHYLSQLRDGWIDDDYMFDMVEEYIGASKLVVLSNNSKYPAYIFNERDGHWSSDNTRWYSNRSYCESKSLFGSKWAKPGQQSLQFDPYIEDDIMPVLSACVICEEHSVFDDVCYNCESCQLCSSSEEHCRCYSSIHDIPDSELSAHMETPV